MTVANIALFYEIHDDTKDGCGCGAFRVLGLFLSAVGMVVNAVVSALAARTGRFTGSFVEISRTVIGGNGPTDTRLFILFLLAVSSTAVAAVFGVVFVTILFSSTRPDVQCPLKRGKTSEAASVEADNVVQWGGIRVLAVAARGKSRRVAVWKPSPRKKARRVRRAGSGSVS